MDITANDEFMHRNSSQVSSPEELDWGIMYELRRNDVNQNTVNITRPFSPAALHAEWRLFSAKKIGTTEMSHDQIELEAMRITEERPNYQLFENNCQNFAKFLVEFMCPARLTPDTITTVLQRWQDSTVEPSGRIPGAYPASVITIVSSPDRTFVTAAEAFDASTRQTDTDPDEHPPPPSVFSFGMTDELVTETDLIESASRLEISDQRVEKWSDAWRRQQLARAFDMHGSFDGWRDLAQAFQREGNYDLAIKVWEKALERNPINAPHFEKEIVRAYDVKAVHEDPVEVYEKAVEDHPSLDALCTRLRDSLIAKQDYRRMIRIFEQSLENYPMQSKFIVRLAEAYSAIGNTDNAISLLEKAIQAHVTDPDLFRELAKCFLAKGNRSRATAVLEMGRAVNPFDVNLSRDLAKLLTKNGHKYPAIEILRNTLRNDPTDASVFDDLSALGDYDRARAILLGALFKNCRSKYIQPVARAYSVKKNYDGGLKFLHRFSELRQRGNRIISCDRRNTFIRSISYEEVVWSSLAKQCDEEQRWIEKSSRNGDRNASIPSRSYEELVWSSLAKQCDEKKGWIEKSSQIEGIERLAFVPVYDTNFQSILEESIRELRVAKASNEGIWNKSGSAFKNLIFGRI